MYCHDTIFKVFQERFNTAPDEVVVEFIVRGELQQSLTVGHIWAGALEVVKRLQIEEVGRGDIVPIVLGHSPWVYSAFLGSIACGAIPTILSPITSRQDPKIFEESFGKLLERLQPKLLLTNETHKSCIPITTAKCVTLDSELSRHTDEMSWEVDAPVDGDTVAFLQHSSGTTGLRKGVILTHSQVLDHLRTYAPCVQFNTGSVVASWLPLYHDMGLICSFLLPVLAGGKIVSIDPEEWVVNPTMLLDWVERKQATHMWLPNFAFHHISRFDRGAIDRDLSTLRYIVNCSEPCRAEAFDAFKEKYESSGLAKGVLQVCYAMAETVFAVTQSKYGQSVKKWTSPTGQTYVSSGVPLNGVDVTILNSRTGEKLPEGEIGEIAVSAGVLFGGYFKDEEKSINCFKHDCYITGDLGFYNAGELFVIGRVDDIVPVNGKNIVAHEIEGHLSTIIGVKPGRVLVYGHYNSALGASQLRVAYEAEAEADPKKMQGEIMKHVSAFAGVAPAKVIALPQAFLLKSTSGKIAREASVKKISDLT